MVSVRCRFSILPVPEISCVVVAVKSLPSCCKLTLRFKVTLFTVLIDSDCPKAKFISL